jgi:hypothetical protein
MAGMTDARVDEPETLPRDDGEGFGVVGHRTTVDRSGSLINE